MRELIDERTAHAVMNLLAVALPLAGWTVGAVVGLMRGVRQDTALGRCVAYSALRGLAFGCIGILNWLLWRVYNAITDRLGLDTVRNLFANLALFAVVGVVGGIVAGQYLRARERHPAAEPPPPGE